MFELIIVITGVLINACIGVFVFTQNPKHIVNQLYGILASSLVVWPIVNYLSLQTDDRLLFIRLVIFFVVVMSAALFYLISALNKQLVVFSRWQWAGIIYTIITAVLTLTPLVFSGLTPGSDPVPIPNIGIVLFLLHLGVFFVGSLIMLLVKIRHTEGRQRLQLLYIFIGMIPLFVFGPVTGFVMPVVFQIADFAALSPVYATFFAVLVGYATIKHRLFDLRLIVARSIAYSLAIATLGLVYGFTVFGFIDDFFPDTRMSVLQQAIYATTAVFLAFTFQPLKRFFDKITDHIFYRDRYETEEVLNRLGKVFVAQSNSFELLDDSLHIITQTLKTKTGHLVVMNEGEIYKIASTAGADNTNITLEQLQSFSDQLSIYDETDYHDAKYEAFHAIGAYVVLRLELQDELIGYLVLGSKQSGTIFTQQDVNLLEILSQELAVAIQNARQYEEIANFGDIMQREVMDATAKLRETNQRLVQLDEAKDEFISMASHQLRTPLTTIKGYLSMLLEGDAGKLSKKQQEFIDMAYVSSQRMVHLISDMLNVSRISTGRLMIEPVEFDLIKTVKDEIGQLRRQAKARDVTLHLHKPKESHIRVNLDESKIRQVMMNFMDNAIYYTPEGKVDVYLETRDGYVEFRVEDNGIGVPKEDQKQLFTKFYRAENARHIRPDGTGLGLYMAKQVIEVQDGEIIFNSEEGQGSTFGFRFKQE